MYARIVNVRRRPTVNISPANGEAVYIFMYINSIIWHLGAWRGLLMGDRRMSSSGAKI